MPTKRKTKIKTETQTEIETKSKKMMPDASEKPSPLQYLSEIMFREFPRDHYI